MSYLEGFEPIAPEDVGRLRKRTHHTREAFDEFLASGHECMAKTFDNPGEFVKTYHSYKNFAYQNKEMGVKVSKAGNSLVLRRAR